MVHVVTADETAAACPGCGVVSSSVKERVMTSPKDIPYGVDHIRTAASRNSRSYFFRFSDIASPYS